jgi:hypothetical protein
MLGIGETRSPQIGEHLRRRWEIRDALR